MEEVILELVQNQLSIRKRECEFLNGSSHRAEISE